ncbi:hypothetical protein E2605_13675 [Dysgonomonas capnocytophagoides]|uniref:Uncharacterized protein n=1 Tax=Dysgonomonas capnocytophagoides TaxID=45254 RepID=A0A4Y8L0D1_9BACT|nr:hypothetical protein [Dysgonomonas capnocytophagoides]TFD95456.1 hypothetical protein E2605_13675 [Dysgonomonas capnocytophagoides]
MSRIENHSIFGYYDQVENRVTSALLQVLKSGGTDFIAEIMSKIDDVEFPSSEITILTQKGENKNIYDGLLECSFSFRVLVESKVKLEAIKERQLNGLIENAKSPNDFILYITPDHEKPQALKKEGVNLYWTNWKDINQILQDVNPFVEPVSFLINEFTKYLDQLGLLEIIEPQNRVQIAAGSYGEPVALEYGFYACQNNRPRKDSNYLAFYNNRGIHSLFEIIGEPINDYDLLQSEDESIKEYLKAKEPNYNSNNKRQFYRLKFIQELDITHNKKNKNGKDSAYTMGVFRYTTIDRILKANTTEEL